MENKKNFNEDLLEEDWHEEDGIYYVPFNEYNQPILPKSHMDLLFSDDEIEELITKKFSKRSE